jgi:hypothetical protein
MPVATVFENLEAGTTIEDLMSWFELSREGDHNRPRFAGRSLAAPDYY